MELASLADTDKFSMSDGAVAISSLPTTGRGVTTNSVPDVSTRGLDLFPVLTTPSLSMVESDPTAVCSTNESVVCVTSLYRLGLS